MKVICNVADHVIFITENEREHVLQFVKPETLPRHSVVHNIGESEEEQVGLKSSMARDGRFCVLSLSNISWHKGVDRLIGVAEALRSAGEKDVVFWVCGREGVAGAMNVMRDEIERKNLEGHFEFLGWVSNPEKFIRDAGAMINLTREGNPWGRDTIEAMVYGKAIITLGTYSKFMEHQETGILLEKYSPEAVAKEIIRLKREPEFRGRLEENAKARAKRLFDGPTQAHIVEGIYDNLIAEAG
jgi:glycosyltransferase involved in cell wall biosynthesis